jgi:type III pantothenate kinase
LNIVVDIGNSRTKVGIFLKQEIVSSFSFEHFSDRELLKLLENYPLVNQSIVSSVAQVPTVLHTVLKERTTLSLEFNHQTAVPLANCYRTPATLGLDRLAAAVGANWLFPGQDLLVIDAGTAITFDLIEKNGSFFGGNISPGLRSRFRALHEFTHKLPLVEETDQYPLLGKTTEEAIQAGVINGIVLEMDGMIELMKKKNPEIATLLTGGDAGFFERRLKSAIFVKFEIILIGLNRILEYNVEKR